MNVLIITQDDVFYLPESLEFLLQNFPHHSRVVAAAISAVSPFGKKESFLKKSWKTLRIFGPLFFLRYSLRYTCGKLRGASVVKTFAKHQVPMLEISGSINSKKSLAQLGAFKPDLMISIAGNQIFRQPLIDLAPKGLLNLHTALLPKYRELMPSFWVLKNNEQETGVSIFFVDRGIDSGPILVQKRITIGKMSQEELIVATKRLGMEAIIEAVNLIEQGNYQLLANKTEEQTYYSFPTAADVRDFLRQGKRFY